MVDGRDNGAALLISAAHVIVRNIEFRRGVLSLFQARDAHVEGCRVHGVGRPEALAVSYSTNVSLQGNAIFDVYFNTRGVALALGRGTTNLTVQRNTIIGADHCVQVQGLDPLYGPYPRGDLIFERNLIVGCHYEAVRVAKGVRLDPDHFRDNLVWNAPSTHFVNTTGGENYYQSECVNGKACVTPGVLHDLHNVSFVPADHHVDPRIVQWNEEGVHFLDVQRNGIAAADSIGAGGPSDYIAVDTTDRPCANMVVNSGFDTGMYAWRVTGNYDQNRYSTGSGWQVATPEIGPEPDPDPDHNPNHNLNPKPNPNPNRSSQRHASVRRACGCFRG